MVGQKILCEGVLDVKSPSSGFARGWRLPPWKRRCVKLVQSEGDVIELQICKAEEKGHIIDTYRLHDVTDVTMVSSKTHLHAFQIVSNKTTILVLAGDTELESRDWIWAMRKVFWPHALVDTDSHDQIRLQLLSNPEVQKVGFCDGIYDLRIRVTAISLMFISKCDPGDPRSTPVEPFRQEEMRTSATIPLTSIARFKLDTTKGRKRLLVDTLPENEYGVCSFVFQSEDEHNDKIDEVMDIVKSTLFRATNNLHDCIASSRWTFDQET